MMFVILICVVSFASADEFDFPYIDVAMDEDKAKDVEIDQPPVAVLETGGNRNLTENPSLESKNKTPKYDWTKHAIVDIAYYLRTQKFNDFDRRYQLFAENATRDLYKAFPRPALRVLHWEVHKHCEPDFLDCLQYLWGRVKKTALRREDDTATAIEQHQLQSDGNYTEQQIAMIDVECRKAFELDDLIAAPFEGPIERFQWRTTASYYLCWYVMHEMPHFQHFNASCDNFASCLDAGTGAHNRDPRADDARPFSCAMYSFCPDPCCPFRHLKSLDACWASELNPCYADNPPERQQCELHRADNLDFVSLVLNKWNTTCECASPGFRWSAAYGSCIDVDECEMQTDNCTLSEACINLPGTYKCVCKWGFEWSYREQKCVESEAFAYIKKITRMEAKHQHQQGSTKAKSVWKYIKSIFFKSK